MYRKTIEIANQEQQAQKDKCSLFWICTRTYPTLSDNLNCVKYNSNASYRPHASPLLINLKLPGCPSLKCQRWEGLRGGGVGLAGKVVECGFVGLFWQRIKFNRQKYKSRFTQNHPTNGLSSKSDGRRSRVSSPRWPTLRFRGLEGEAQRVLVLERDLFCFRAHPDGCLPRSLC